MFNKLFGDKKSDSYYRELKETEDRKSVAQDESPVESVEQTQAKSAEATVVEEQAEPTPAKGAKKASTNNKKSAKKEVIVEDPKPKAPPTPEELIKAAVAKATSSNGKPEAEEVGFASKHLITSTLSRRRPGPSLNPFKDMASQVNRRG